MASKADFRLRIGVPSIEVNRLFSIFSDMTPGEQISYEDLTSKANFDIRLKRGYYIAAKRRVERERAIVIYTVPKMGIRRALNEDIPSLAYADIRALSRRARRALRTLACTDYNSLDLAAKQKYNVSATMLGLVDASTRANSVKRIEGAVEKSNAALIISETLKYLT